MRGRDEFTVDELDRIRRLLVEKQKASASRQKRLRAELRKIGFYISDFGSVERAFTVDDLERLVRSNRIKAHRQEPQRGLLSRWIEGLHGILVSVFRRSRRTRVQD